MNEVRGSLVTPVRCRPPVPPWLLVDEILLVAPGEFTDAGRRNVADSLNDVVGPGEDPISVILGNVLDVLHSMLAKSLPAHSVCERLDADRFVAELHAERVAQRLGYLKVVQFDSTVERVFLAVARAAAG
jgi:hypothetical protein